MKNSEKYRKGMDSNKMKDSRRKDIKTENHRQRTNGLSSPDKSRAASFLLHHPTGLAIFLFYAVMWLLNGSHAAFLLGTITAIGTMAMETIIRNSFSDSNPNGKAATGILSKNTNNNLFCNWNRSNTVTDDIHSETPTPDVFWSLTSLFSAPSAGKIIVLRKAF